MEPCFSEAKQRITVLSQSIEKREVVEMGEIEREYIKKFATSIGLSEFLREVDMETEDDGIHLTGKHSKLQESKLECAKSFSLV